MLHPCIIHMPLSESESTVLSQKEVQEAEEDGIPIVEALAANQVGDTIIMTDLMRNLQLVKDKAY